MKDCECFRIGGPFIAEDPNCTVHGDAAIRERDEVLKSFENLRDTLQLGEYRHYKGGLYLVFAVSVDEATLRPLVHYRGDGVNWTRTLENFQDLVNDAGETSHAVRRFTFVRPL